MYKKILIATDGSELAQKGVAHGLELAKGLGATVAFATVS
ncbi:MAG: universal stress protein, partial [Mesorhizobium sp.]